MRTLATAFMSDHSPQLVAPKSWPHGVTVQCRLRNQTCRQSDFDRHRPEIPPPKRTIDQSTPCCCSCRSRAPQKIGSPRRGDLTQVRCGAVRLRASEIGQSKEPANEGHRSRSRPAAGGWRPAETKGNTHRRQGAERTPASPGAAEPRQVTSNGGCRGRSEARSESEDALGNLCCCLPRSINYAIRPSKGQKLRGAAPPGHWIVEVARGRFRASVWLRDDVDHVASSSHEYK